ncbi:MAG: hypothetical protein ACM3OG_06515 [Actinomycetota bacterium]
MPSVPDDHFQKFLAFSGVSSEDLKETKGRPSALGIRISRSSPAPSPSISPASFLKRRLARPSLKMVGERNIVAS